MPVDVELADESPVKSVRSPLVWAYALTVGRFGITAGVTIVMAAFLDPRAYGVMALAMVWVSFAQGLALYGPTQAVIQREDVTSRHFDAAFWVAIGVAVVETVLFAALAPLWAAMNDAPDLVYVCWAIAPAILLNALVVVPDAILRRRLEFRRLSQRVLAAGIVSGVAGVVVAISGGGVWALVVQQLTLTGLSLVAIWSISPWRPSFGPVRPALRDLRKFSLHSVSEFFATFLSGRADALVLGIFFGPIAIGLFRFLARITDIVTEVAAGGLGQFSLPHLSRHFGDRDAFTDQAARMVHAVAILAVPAFGILAPAGTDLLALLGPEWTQDNAALWVLCLGGGFSALATILGPIIQAAGRPGTNAALYWVKAAVTAVAVVAIGARFDSSGPATQVFAIAVTLVAIHVIFVSITTFVLFRTMLGASVWSVLRPAWPAVVAALAAACAGRLVQVLVPIPVPIGALAVTGTTATVVAVVTLFALDPEVNARVRRTLARITRRGAAPVPANASLPPGE
jgi:O-antigen/teichoic acid export membrane protein